MSEVTKTAVPEALEDAVEHGYGVAEALVEDPGADLVAADGDGVGDAEASRTP